MTDKIKNRPEDQKLPVASESPHMHDIARVLLESRKELGVKRYGQPLQAFNGRDAVQDVLEEALDSAAYAAQLAWEQSHPESTYIGKIVFVLAQAIHTSSPDLVDFGDMFVPESVVKLLSDFQIPFIRNV